MPTIYIDNKAYEVKSGKNLLETCLTLGFNLPYFCWHPSLGSVGACRQCAVKSFKNEEDKKGRLVMACMEPVVNDQRISIEDAEAHEFREHIIEWLMTNHPHDCAVCDEGGSCHLQDMTVMTGHNYRRYTFKKRTYRNQYLGPFINHEMNRCIQCYRCVRFYKDYAGGEDLDVFASRSNVYFGRHEDGILENEFSGNLAEVCPTGVFTDKTLKEHYTRKWDLTTAPSVCQHCSLGCNTLAGERYGSLRLISNRYNGEVNGYFLCDRGRFGYEFVNSENRIRKPIVKRETGSEANGLEAIVPILKTNTLIGIGSPRASVQSNFALKNLVGDENFYQGVSAKELSLNQLAVKILSKGLVRSFCMKEVEKADAVLILGEDLTNTAPMMALAVRQTVRQQPLEQVTQAKIPLWNDAAARELIQDAKGPLFIGSTNNTKLDEISSRSFYGTPDDLARIGFAIANLIDNNSPGVSGLSTEHEELAKEISKALGEAKTPVIISGTSCMSEAVMMASSNIAEALYGKNKNSGIVLIPRECNSVGLTMLGGKSLTDAFAFVKQGNSCTAIVLENDLYHHSPEQEVDSFLSNCKNIIVADHTNHRTALKARVVLPTGTFAEADGIIINNEGRAQRFYQVYEPAGDVLEAWRWMMRLGEITGNSAMTAWKNIDDINRAIATKLAAFKGIEKVAPPSDFRINGQKIPRESHRFSGRTSILANINVSEPKPPDDVDSPMSYTMEGFRGQPPSSMIPFFWSPGWNSVQSTNKYQTEVGGPLRDGDPGVMMITPDGNKSAEFFKYVGERVATSADSFQIVPLYHIFGSEEQSSLGEAVSQRIPVPYVMMNVEDASRMQIKESDVASINVNGKVHELAVRVSASLPKGTIGVPLGLPGLTYFEIPSSSTVKRIGIKETQPQ